MPRTWGLALAPHRPSPEGDLAVLVATQRFFANPNSLPSMPEVAMQLMKSFNNDNIGLADLAQIVGKDPALAAKVLRLANSARYRPAHDIGTLRDAAAVLGMDTLRNLALSACLSGAFPPVRGLDRGRFWRHSMATAAYAQLLSKWMQLDTEAAYLAGLMLRTGQILMAQAEPDLVADEESLVDVAGCRVSLEISRFGCTHGDVTAELAQRWHFPATLVEAFAQASEPMAAHPFSLQGAVLRMAEVLADAHDMETSGREALEEAEPELLAHLHIDMDWLETRLTEAGDVLEGMTSLVSH
jgi:HD-like signal output (HDOD) protein